jgi:RNA polymerase sigma-70 factor (ECF subfamily)
MRPTGSWGARSSDPRFVSERASIRHPLRFRVEDEKGGVRPLNTTMTSLDSAPVAEGVRRDSVRLALPARPSAEFEAVYREYFRFVWRCIKRLGIEGPAIDDVVQETFLVVHRRLADFEGRSSTKTWLYGIVRRVIADHRRTQRRKPAADADLDRVQDDVDRGPEARAEHAEQVVLLHRVLGLLDDEKREVLILAEFEGMTMAEIAEALDVNPNTISSRLRAARQRFEEALEHVTQQDTKNEAMGPDATARRAQ